jgi:4-hydroxybenzoate polyprenyltransferase
VGVASKSTIERDGENQFRNAMTLYARLMRLDRPIGTLLLLWPMLWGLWIASEGRPDPHVFAIFVLGVIVMRAAGCVINDFADRKLDAHVRRTRDRPLASGQVAPFEALLLFAGLGLIAIGLVLTLNRLSQLLAIVGAALAIVYPFTKRVFSLPQFVLGAAFTWSIPMVYAAQTGAVPRLAWLLFFAGLLWSAAYDTMYAMVDREDDLKIGIKSTAILFGDLDRLIIGIMQLMVLLALWLVGNEAHLGIAYRCGLALAACFALYQQRLIRARRPEDCFRAFLNNNYFGMAVFLGLVLDYL